MGNVYDEYVEETEPCARCGSEDVILEFKQRIFIKRKDGEILDAGDIESDDEPIQTCAKCRYEV